MAASLSAASLLALTIYPRVCARRRVPGLGRRRLATRAHAAPRPSEGVGAAAAFLLHDAHEAYIGDDVSPKIEALAAIASIHFNDNTTIKKIYNFMIIKAKQTITLIKIFKVVKI